jgi:hypothetical protein
MKYLRTFSIFLFMFALSLNARAFDRHVENLTPSMIDTFYIHTNHHDATTLHNIAIIHLVSTANVAPGTTGVCDSGFWLDTEKNSAAYSMILAAIVSKNNINVEYSTQPSPWNNPSYCAMIRVGIK